MTEFCSDLLRLVWAVDSLTARGEHGRRGVPGGLSVLGGPGEPSDDFLANAAMFHLCQSSEMLLGVPPTRSSVYALGRAYIGFLKPHMLIPEKFGRVTAKLLEADEQEHITLVLGNKGCGSAMRAVSTFLLTHDIYQMFSLFLVTHAHPESLAGAYSVAWCARSILEDGPSSSKLESRAIRGAGIGDAFGRLAHSLFTDATPHDARDLGARISEVLHGGEGELHFYQGHEVTGTSAFFVVPAAMFLVHQFQRDRSLKRLLDRAVEIGGDPDTIATIAASLAYCLDPRGVLEEIEVISRDYGLRIPGAEYFQRTI